jgi:hypothetical protein
MRRLCAPSGLAPGCGVTHIKIARGNAKKMQDDVMIVIPQALRNIPTDLFACQLMQEFLQRH